jgi:hypothetical protein
MGGSVELLLLLLLDELEELDEGMDMDLLIPSRQPQATITPHHSPRQNPQARLYLGERQLL